MQDYMTLMKNWVNTVEGIEVLKLWEMMILSSSLNISNPNELYHTLGRQSLMRELIMLARQDEFFNQNNEVNND